MKLKIYVIDFEIPARVKAWVLRLGILALLLGSAAVAIAAGPLHVWATGDTLQATDLNGAFKNLDDRVIALEAQAHAPSAFHATLTAATSLPNLAITTVVFDHVDYDLAKAAGAASEYSPVTGAFAPHAGGVYLINCLVEFNFAPAATVNWAVVLNKNGAVMANTDTTVISGALSQGITQQVALAAGDTITCGAFHDNGGTVNLEIQAGVVRNSFSATRLY